MTRKLKRTKAPKDLKPVIVRIQCRAIIQQGYLSKLIWLLRTYRELQGSLTEEGTLLINRSIYACLLECIDNGIKDEAFEALRRFRVNFRFSARKTGKKRSQLTVLPK